MVLREQTPEEHPREQAVSDVVAMYLDSVASRRPLDERRFAVARRWITYGWFERADTLLIAGNLAVCVRIADRYSDSGVGRLDLIQAANLGLVEVARRRAFIRQSTFTEFSRAVVSGVTDAVEARIRGHDPDAGLSGDREPRHPLPPDRADEVALELPDDG